MFVPQYGGEGAVRYTAASGYAPVSAQVFDTTTNANVAINATRHVVYVAAIHDGLGVRHRHRVAFWRHSVKKRLLDHRGRG